jgi:glycosyltransferase involved in cell wall biosynthesis
MTSGPRADFRASAAPAVTVVMLAWKQPELLLRSLAALAAQADERVEVVLVLNGATPEVHEAVATRVTGAVVVIADLNIGFGGACNLGATSARGEFLVFLSDDTEVTPGWLDELLAVVRAHPEAGVVASVLLDPDGSIQEAGSRVLPDGTTLPLAAGRAVADASGFLADRPVDYGSGAAMLMPRDLFEQLGGFDPAFYPAYYEDVDLAFRRGPRHPHRAGVHGPGPLPAVRLGPRVRRLPRPLGRRRRPGTRPRRSAHRSRPRRGGGTGSGPGRRARRSARTAHHRGGAAAGAVVGA